MQRLEQIAETYAWYHSVGNHVEEHALARYVRHVEHSDVWVANHLSRVRAQTPAEIEQVLRHADQLFAHCTHRMVMVDPLTPEAFVARMALEDFRELTPTLQMVLEGSLKESGARVELRPVVTDSEWQAMYALVRANHIEGKSSHGLHFDDELTRRMVAGYRAKATVAQFFCAFVEDAVCAYGCSVIGPHGLGIVEDLFTLPAYRKRGIATAIIQHAVEHARARGMGPMLIGPHVTEEPKKLYATLGFVPQCITRPYLLETEEPHGGVPA